MTNSKNSNERKNLYYLLIKYWEFFIKSIITICIHRKNNFSISFIVKQFDIEYAYIRRYTQSIALITGQCACDLTWTREIERNGAMAREKLQITRRYFERHIGKAQRVNRMSARQRTERERKKKAPRGGRACIFDNYSTVDLRADGLRIGGGGGEVNGEMNEQVGRKGGEGSRHDCGVAGLVSESRVQPSGSYEYII